MKSLCSFTHQHIVISCEHPFLKVCSDKMSDAEIWQTGLKLTFYVI